MDRFEALTAFVAVADEGGFAAAARVLGQSPSSITRHIAALEARYQTSLFHRSTRSVVLSHEGAVLLERARTLLAELRETEQLLVGGETEPRGEIHVTAPVMYGQLHVVPVITRLMKAHAELNVRLLLSDRNVRLVEEGVDVAVRIGEMPDSNLMARRISEVRFITVASPDYLARRGMPTTPEEIAMHDIIQMTSISSEPIWRFSDTVDPGPLKPRLIVNSIEAGLAAAREGAGLVQVLDYQAEASLKSGRLVQVLADFTPASLSVRLVYLAGRASIPGVRAFLDCMSGQDDRIA